MVEGSARISRGVRRLVVVYHVVDILGVAFGQRLAVVGAHPKVAEEGRRSSLNVGTKLLSNRERNDTIGDCDVYCTDSVHWMI